jgi:MFS family permease
MNSGASDYPRNRWTLLAMVSIAFVINFLDRQVLSVLAPTIRHELSLSQTQYGQIVFSFLLGMALFQIPNGLLMDRVGRAKDSASLYAPGRWRAALTRLRDRCWPSAPYDLPWGRRSAAITPAV